MHVQFLVGLHEGGIQITMLDRITATPEKMAGAAVTPSGTSHGLSDSGPVGREKRLAIEFGGFGDRISGLGGKFLVGTCLVMTDQTVDLGRVGEIKGLVLPPVPGMAGGAPGLVGLDVDAEIVHHQSALAHLQGRVGIGVEPGPVDGLVNLGRSLGMA